MSEIPYYRYFYRALLLVLVKPNVLQPLIDIKMEISLFIEMLCPPSYKLLLYVLHLGRDIHYSLTKELDYAIFEGLLAGVPYPN
jgi:hypothetical protein